MRRIIKTHVSIIDEYANFGTVVKQSVSWPLSEKATLSTKLFHRCSNYPQVPIRNAVCRMWTGHHRTSPRAAGPSAALSGRSSIGSSRCDASDCDSSKLAFLRLVTIFLAIKKRPRDVRKLFVVVGPPPLPMLLLLLSLMQFCLAASSAHNAEMLF